MSVEDFGIYNAYMSYEAILSILMTIGAAVVIRSAWIDFHEKYDYFEKHLTSLMFLFFLAITIICLIIDTIFDGLFSTSIGLNRMLLLCLMIHSSGYGFVIVMSEKYRMELKAVKVLLISAVITLSSIFLSLFIISYQENQKYIGRIIGAALPYIIVWIYYLIRSFFYRVSFEKKIFKYILSIGLPSIPYILSENIILQSDRLMIEHISGAYEAGIYSAISTVASIMFIIGTSLEGAWVPWSYETIDNGNIKELKNTTTIYILFYTFLIIGFTTISPELIRLFTSKPDYWNNMDIIYPLVIMQYMLFIIKIPLNLMLFYKKVRLCLLGIISAAAINIISNYVVITMFNYKWAAFTSIVSVCILGLLLYSFCKKLSFNYYNLNNISIMLLLTCAYVFVEYLFRDLIIYRYLIFILVMGVLFLLFKKYDLLQIIKKLNK